MNLDEILVVPTKSRYEIELMRHGNHEAVMRELVFDSVREKVMDSHAYQKKNLEFFLKFFNPRQIFDRDALTQDMLRNYKLLISLGGDDHFKYLSHLVGNNLIMGVKLDERRSVGALLYFSKHNFEQALAATLNDSYQTEHWTRLEGKVNGNTITSATCDYLVGELDRGDMSRYIIRLDGLEEEQRSSGLLITTGAGSTGWFNSIFSEHYHRNGYFGHEERTARAIATETTMGTKVIALNPGQIMTLVSYNDSEGIIRPDSIKEHTASFPMGSFAQIKISNNYLNVVSIPSLR